MIAMRNRVMQPLRTLQHKAWPVSKAVATRLDASQPIEEEKSPYYNPGCFYPARLGEVLDGRYQIVTKLGYGSGSSIWLARDLQQFVLLFNFLQFSDIVQMAMAEREICCGQNKGKYSESTRESFRR